MSDLIQQAVEAKIHQHGGLRAAARAMKISASYLARLRDGIKHAPSDRVLTKLGLVREVTYRWK